MRCFKLTNQNMQTYRGFQYTLHEWTPKLSGAGLLCGPSWYHAYDHSVLAALFNPIHADIRNPRLFEASYDGRMITLDDHGMKRGVVRLRLDKEIPLFQLTQEQRVRFAIYCARRVYASDVWTRWAQAWLDGSDRTAAAANSVSLSVADIGSPARTCARQSLAAAAKAEYRYYAPRAAQAVARAGKTPGVNGWAGLVEEAIADENKFQEEKTT